MLERALLTALIIGLGIVAWVVINRLALRRAAQSAPVDPLLAGLRKGTKAIVYFTTPFCDPCRTQQMPALKQLEAELGENIQIVKVDATEQTDAADRWGVFSAPTTFVLDADHRPQRVNRGPATAEQLKQQLSDVA